MYAVLKTGGKQYKVAEGDEINVEKIEANVGDSITLSEVLMVAGEGQAQVGTPLIDGAAVTAEVVGQFKAPKIIVFKKKRRKNYRRKNGHRQPQTKLRITGINK